MVKSLFETGQNKLAGSALNRYGDTLVRMFITLTKPLINACHSDQYSLIDLRRLLHDSVDRMIDESQSGNAVRQISQIGEVKVSKVIGIDSHPKFHRSA